MKRAPVHPLLGCALLLASCAVYDPPPHVTIAGAVDGLLTDPAAPLVLSFSEPIDPATLKVNIVRDDLDAEGNLADEADPPRELTLFYEHNAGLLDDFGTSEMAPDGRSFTIHPAAALPVGPRLALLVEPGLADTSGNDNATRLHIPFGYSFDLECDAPSTVMSSASLFLLIDVEKPIEVPVQLFARVLVDPDTGAVRAQFTNADRNPALGRCPFPCGDTEVCRLLPEPECVAPSERAVSTDEFSDYIPNATPPTGFTFEGRGCVVDQPDGSAAFSIAPTDVEVQQPKVTLRNARMTAAFALGDDGVLRGSGLLSSDDVLLGTSASGRGEASLSARAMAPDETPPGIPEPAPEP
jgi:hypothetical protein